MSSILKNDPLLADRPGWIPPEITENWDTNPYAYQTEEELMPGGGLHGQLLAYLMELLRFNLKARGLMLLLDTFMLYRDRQGIKQRISPDLLLMPYAFPPPSAYDLDVEPPPLCVVEVTSPNSHYNDLQKKVSFYMNLGIPTYLVIDAITPRAKLREQIVLHQWQCRDDQVQKISADTDGNLPLLEMGLRIRTQGQRIIISDAVSGEILSDNEELQAELQALRTERQALQTEIEVRLAAEAEIVRLKALLKNRF